MLVSDIVRRVRESAGDVSVIQVTNSTLTDWINDAIRECVVDQSLLQSKASSSTVISQTDYTLPSDIYKLHSVTYNGQKLRMLTREEWEEYYSGATPVGNATPQVCYKFADTLTLSPAPDDVQSLVIYYTKLPATIVWDGSGNAAADWSPQAPPINEAYHNRIVSYCLAQFALQDDDNYKYNLLMTEFRTGVKEIDTRTDDDLYPFISVSARDSGDGFDY